MKAVLISIQPKWCELIASGKKTVEVRKTKPKIETPFKCYIYETKALYKPNGCKCFYEGRGQVIGEFVCRRIDAYPYNKNGYGIAEEHLLCTLSCIEEKELYHYLQGSKPYAWNISDLVIYDKPKELREFKPYNRTEDDCKFSNLGYAIPKCEDCHECYVKRPPQSWCYVEGLKGE